MMTSKMPTGMVRVAPMRAIVALLREAGHDPEKVFTAAGTDLNILRDPDNTIPFATRVHLLKVCAELTGCDHFGLLLGQRNSLSAFGMVGYYCMHSPTVKSALESLVRYMHLHVQGAGVSMERSGNSAYFGYQIYQPLSESTYQLEDAAVASAYNVIRELCGADWGATEIWFSHLMPKDVSPYHKFFQAQLRFNMEKSGIFFSARWLQRPVKAADPELRRLLYKQIDELEANYRESFVEQVRHTIQSALLARQCSAEYIAALFSLHSRTFHRRLKAEGATFQSLVDETRYHIARQMLANSEATPAHIADVLGYADVRSLNRAFKRWSGSTPAQWRKAQR
jgi:AraC-like DNA-binding protein